MGLSPEISIKVKDEIHAPEFVVAPDVSSAVQEYRAVNPPLNESCFEIAHHQIENNAIDRYTQVSIRTAALGVEHLSNRLNLPLSDQIKDSYALLRALNWVKLQEGIEGVSPGFLSDPRLLVEICLQFDDTDSAVKIIQHYPTLTKKPA